MSKQYSQHFRQEWLKHPELKNWLISAADNSKASCKICHCVLNAKKCDLIDHSKTSKHLSASKLIQHPKCSGYFKPLETSAHNNVEAAMCTYIAEHCSIRSVEHLTDLCNKYFVESNSKFTELKLRRTKCNAIICNLLDPHFLAELVKDVSDQMFSLLIDASNDIATTKLLEIAIRYFSVSTKTFVNNFLGLVEFKSYNAEGIVEALKMFLVKCNLKLINLIGIGTDNAAVMVGIHNGVYEKLKLDVPNLIIIKCVWHSLQLALSSANSETLPRSLDFL